MSMPQPAPEPASALEPSVLADLRERLVEARDFHLSRIAAAEEGVDDIAMAVGHRSEAALKEVEAALDAVAEGSYGTCTGCGKAINPERLEAIPHARACAACAATSRR